MIEYETPEISLYQFTRSEQARLEIYRKAVKNGFYNEGCEGLEASCHGLEDHPRAAGE